MLTKEGPDSARSWVVASAGFVITFLLLGIIGSSGLLYVAVIETYGISRMEANMPFTLMTIMDNVLGPLVGVVGQRFGARVVTIAGGLIAAIGVGLCSVAPDVVWLSLFWGGIHGIGSSLGNTLFQVIVYEYFEKHRATASGFSLSGASIGAFAFTYFFEYLLANIGLSGTFLLTGGLILHVVPAAMLMKEPHWIKKKPEVSLQKNMDYDSVQSEKRFSEKEIISEKSSENSGPIFAIAFRRISSAHNMFSKRQQNGVLKLKSDDFMKQDGVGNQSFQDKLVEEITAEKLKTDNRTSSSPGNNFSIYRDIKHMIRDPMFHIISISMAALTLLYNCTTIAIDYLKDKGIPEDDGKYFIIVMAAGDFVGRLGFGWVTDRKYLSLHKYMMLLQIIQGCCFGMIPFFYSFVPLMILVVVFGVARGASIIMYPVLVAHHLPSVQPLAIGSIFLMGGLAAFGVPSMIGYFRDTLGSYDGLFFVFGAFSILTGLLWGLEPLFIKMKRKMGRMEEDRCIQMSPQDQQI